MNHDEFQKESDIKCFLIAEALGKLKVANTHPDSKVTEQLVSKEESNITPQYKKMQVSMIVHGDTSRLWSSSLDQ